MYIVSSLITFFWSIIGGFFSFMCNMMICMGQIMMMFYMPILMVIVPTILFGGIIGWFIGRKNKKGDK